MNDEKMTFLLVEDSEHDVLAFRRAWRDNDIAHELRVVRDGRECLDYLQGHDPYEGQEDRPRPDVIVLNDHLPKMSGQSVLAALQQNEAWAAIPVIVFTASQSPRKELHSYARCANAYIVKPMTYEDLSRTVRRLCRFWELVEIPETPS